MPPRIETAKQDIVRYFDSQSQHIFDMGEIARILELQRESWRLAQTTRTGKFIEFLAENTQLKIVRFAFPYRPVVKYKVHMGRCAFVRSSVVAKAWCLSHPFDRYVLPRAY